MYMSTYISFTMSHHQVVNWSFNQLVLLAYNSYDNKSIVSTINRISTISCRNLFFLQKNNHDENKTCLITDSFNFSFSNDNIHTYAVTCFFGWWGGRRDGVKRYYQQYFSYIVAFSFIGRRNRSTRKKPSICCTSLTNFIT